MAALTEAGTRPGLAVVIVGDDSASKVYVANKEKACEELGMYSEKYAMREDTTEEELLELINKLNADDNIQLARALVDHIDVNACVSNRLKDASGNTDIFDHAATNDSHEGNVLMRVNSIWIQALLKLFNNGFLYAVPEVNIFNNQGHGIDT